MSIEILKVYHIKCILFIILLSVWQETHIGKTVNALKKRKGVVGSSALNLVSSWKQLVNEASKPKPKIVVEPCHSPSEDEDEDEEDEDDEDEEATETISHSRLFYCLHMSILSNFSNLQHLIIIWF